MKAPPPVKNIAGHQQHAILKAMRQQAVEPDDRQEKEPEEVAIEGQSGECGMASDACQPLRGVKRVEGAYSQSSSSSYSSVVLENLA